MVVVNRPNILVNLFKVGTPDAITTLTNTKGEFFHPVRISEDLSHSIAKITPGLGLEVNNFYN